MVAFLSLTVALVALGARPSLAQVETKAGTLTAPTSGGTPQDQVITGVGFQPQVVFFFWTTQAATGFTTDARYGYGFATGPSNEAAIAGTSTEGRTSFSSAGRWQSQSRCIVIVNLKSVGGFDSEAELKSMDAEFFGRSPFRQPPFKDAKKRLANLDPPGVKKFARAVSIRLVSGSAGKDGQEPWLERELEAAERERLCHLMNEGHDASALLGQVVRNDGPRKDLGYESGWSPTVHPVTAGLPKQEYGAQGIGSCRNDVTLTRPGGPVSHEGTVDLPNRNPLVAQELDSFGGQQAGKARLAITGVTREDEGLAVDDCTAGMHQEAAPARQGG